MILEWLSVAIFLSVMLHHFIKYKTEPYLPSLLTTLGILGTFTGIIIGLWNFDTSNINQSITGMIDGLRTAAICSAFGMFLAILSKKEHQKYIQFNQADDEITSKTFIELLEKINQSIATQTLGIELLSTQLASIPEDTTRVLSEMRNQTDKVINSIDSNNKKHTDVLKSFSKQSESNHEKHMDAFNKFSEQIVDNSTSALVHSLEKVVKDFNQKVNAQFGDNFSLFNEALDKLLKWQEDYHQDIGEMQQQFDRCLEGIQNSEQALSSLGTEATSLLEIAQNLKQLMDSCEESREFLSANLESFKSLASQAKDALPLIESNIEQLTKGLKDHITGSVKQLNDAVQAEQEAFNKIISSFKTLENNAISYTDSTFKMLNAKLIEQNENTARQIQAITYKVSEQTEILNSALEKELTKSLSSLGSQLASLSQKFVNDYGPLTEKLREVVLISQNANGMTRSFSN